MFGELTLTVKVYIKETEYSRSTGIRPKTIKEAIPADGGYLVVTPRYPTGLFHHSHECLALKSRGKR